MLASASPAWGAATSLASGDVLDVSVFGEQTLTEEVTVARDGSITLPLIGRIVVSGMSTTDVAQKLTTDFKRYLRAPMVAVAIHTEAPYSVLVLGNVKNPGRYTVPPGSRLSAAIAAAGGLGPTSGPLPQARVAVGDDIHNISLENLLRRGDVDSDVLLADGAAVYVTAPATIRVRVLGAVDHPGDVEVNQGDRVEIAVAKAGNSVNAGGDLNRVHVTHRAPDGTEHVTDVDLYKVLEQGDSAADVTLASDDVVFVPQVSKNRPGNFLGSVFSTLRAIFLPY